MVEMGTVLELDNGKTYTVVSKVKYQEKEYLYLIDVNDNTNMMFCEFVGDELIAISDEGLIQKLVLLVHLDVNKD